ncbi:hypothetical protein GLOIN_2v1826762 [Rhizophagus irregularis DAOM 181602=DAOM 197198]|uniref:Uncharacterized protein n=1 Tax=Rhizophagus irregularis (strain DAOM 181602 / DAOM 197198 / MUCL 43194) TaxID=747089 RepID=A0A2P4Q865_RHIID|nr:hypothetical protein GLOIN_2v1826762 [Rhizophagus irregularis DAOM 181602=DAOM 197198]POG73827.1 hypothetical protein GLOIN_2v1826762 [Rhizophagus irregularis DAOM 181602=DAOM 197198]|eukprot:XP_025180693.1 hypothetical protein GLOIN_2v1826762 [Rhizophagus irregularis DAOM 181602=DAOM 197198]
MVEIAPENEKLFEWSFKCETKYITDSKVCYTINWKEGRVDWNISSTKSSTAVTNLFLQISSRSQQNKRLNSFGRDVQKAIDELIIKHKLTNLSGEPIVHLCYIELDYKEDQQAYIKFKNPNNSSAIQTRVDAIVRFCDEAVLGRDGYRNLAAVVPTLFREYLFANRLNEMNELMNMQIHIGIFNIDNEINNQSNIDNNINNNVNDILVDDHEIVNGAFRSILDILKILIPIWKAGQNPVIFPGDTLYIKIGGDGRNV